MKSMSPPVVTTQKIGLNGVTTITKVIKARRQSRGLSATRDRGSRVSRDPPLDAFPAEESWRVSGLFISDDFGEINSNHRSLTLTRLTKVADANVNGKLRAGSLLKFVEETGTVLCTRYCNYTAAEQSIRSGSIYDQVHCGMVYLQFLELLLPAYAGQLLTCVADIYYTASHAVEIKSVMWAEDLTTCSRRLVCRASAWYVAFNVHNEWKLCKVPKMHLDLRLEKEGGVRYEQYKQDRNNFNSHKIQHKLPQHITGEEGRRESAATAHQSDLLLTHVADIHDCGTHMYMHCGAVVDKMEEAASMVAKRHSRAQEVTFACGYHFNFLELVPRGSLVFFFARMTFTSRRMMEVEVLVDIETMEEQMLRTKRVAVGFLCFVAFDGEKKPVAIPSMKLHGLEAKERFAEGETRYDNMKMYLKYTEAQNVVEVKDSKKVATFSKSPDSYRV